MTRQFFYSFQIKFKEIRNAFFDTDVDLSRLGVVQFCYHSIVYHFEHTCSHSSNHAGMLDPGDRRWSSYRFFGKSPETKQCESLCSIRNCYTNRLFDHATLCHYTYISALASGSPWMSYSSGHVWSPERLLRGSPRFMTEPVIELWCQSYSGGILASITSNR